MGSLTEVNCVTDLRRVCGSLASGMKLTDKGTDSGHTLADDDKVHSNQTGKFDFSIRAAISCIYGLRFPALRSGFAPWHRKY